MEDEFVIRVERPLPWLRRSLFGIYRWLPMSLIFLVVIGGVGLLGALDPGPGPFGGWLPCLAGLGIALLWIVPRHLKLARKLYTDGKTKGEPIYTATTERIRCEYDGNVRDLQWSSVHSVCVSRHTLYVFVDRNSAWFIPRGAHEDRLIALARSARVRIRGA
jgi:hypothetical protein